MLTKVTGMGSRGTNSSTNIGAHMSRSSAIWVVALAGFALGVGTAYGQVARSGGSANAQLAEELQQLASERTELQAQNAKLQKELASMRKERDSLKAAQQALERRSKLSESTVKQLQESVTARREATEKEIAQWRERMQELVAKAREIAQNLRDVETDRNSLKQTLATRDRDLKTCIDHNLALYQISEEALTRLDHQTLWSGLARAEPFTRIKRIQLDNLVEEYRERADAQRMSTPHAGSTTAAPSGALSPAPANTPAPTGASPPTRAAPATSAAPPTAALK